MRRPCAEISAFACFLATSLCALAETAPPTAPSHARGESSRSGAGTQTLPGWLDRLLRVQSDIYAVSGNWTSGSCAGHAATAASTGAECYAAELRSTTKRRRLLVAHSCPFGLPQAWAEISPGGGCPACWPSSIRSGIGSAAGWDTRLASPPPLCVRNLICNRSVSPLRQGFPPLAFVWVRGQAANARPPSCPVSRMSAKRRSGRLSPLPGQHRSIQFP